MLMTSDVVVREYAARWHAVPVVFSATSTAAASSIRFSRTFLRVLLSIILFILTGQFAVICASDAPSGIGAVLFERNNCIAQAGLGWLQLLTCAAVVLRFPLACLNTALCTTCLCACHLRQACPGLSVGATRQCPGLPLRVRYQRRVVDVLSDVVVDQVHHSWEKVTKGVWFVCGALRVRPG
jgi:hypothetical protein